MRRVCVGRCHRPVTRSRDLSPLALNCLDRQLLATGYALEISRGLDHRLIVYDGRESSRIRSRHRPCETRRLSGHQRRRRGNDLLRSYWRVYTCRAILHLGGRLGPGVRVRIAHGPPHRCRGRLFAVLLGILLLLPLSIFLLFLADLLPLIIEDNHTIPRILMLRRLWSSLRVVRVL